MFMIRIPILLLLSRPVAKLCSLDCDSLEQGYPLFIVSTKFVDDEIYFMKLRVYIKDNNNSPHHVSFIDFYFHFLTNFQT